MAITIERQGARIYLVGNTFPHKDAIKSMGGHWDGDRRAWWFGAKKEAEARKLLEEVGAGFDLHDATDRAVRADQMEEAGKTDEASALRAGPPKEDLDDKRVYAQVEYKGRRYYVIAETRDMTRCRLTTLDGTEPFWADMPACNLIRTYEGRQVWDGRRYSGKTVMRYPTIGSMRKFRDQQQQGEKDGTPACTACGKRSNHLVHDLEDGLMKCSGCADMPE